MNLITIPTTYKKNILHQNIVSSLTLADVCLVANLQTMGPTFIASANENIFDHGAGMLLAARIVITSGMGNSSTGTNKLNGPIPISELDLGEDYQCYFYPMPMQQQPKPDNQFSTGKGTYIICLIVPTENKNDFRPFEGLMERSLEPMMDEFDFSETISGEIPTALREKFSTTLSKINDEINTQLELAAKYQGGSLYDIGLITTLPESLSKTAKKLMLNPKGIRESEISNKVALKTLYQAGLIEIEKRDDGDWIIPR